MMHSAVVLSQLASAFVVSAFEASALAPAPVASYLDELVLGAHVRERRVPPDAHAESRGGGPGARIREARNVAHERPRAHLQCVERASKFRERHEDGSRGLPTLDFTFRVLVGVRRHLVESSVDRDVRS